MFFPLLILAGLLLINAIFAMSEIAVVSARRVRLEPLAAKGDRGAKLALKLIDHPTRFLSTVQVGITVVAVLAGVFGEKTIASQLELELARIPLIAPAASVIAIVVVVGTITFFSVVIGELVPKRIGLAYPETIARTTAGPMMVLSKIATPLVVTLSASCEAILALLRIKSVADTSVSEDDVRAMIRRGGSEGIFHESEQRILDRVLRLDDLKVRALMVSRSDIVWLDAAAPAATVRLTVATSPYSHFPVCDGSFDNLLGFVHIKDLVKHGLIAGDEMNLRELARPALFVPENTAALKFLDVLKAKRQHLAVVVDEYGAMQGLITLNDVMDTVLGTFPAVMQGADSALTGGEAALTVREDGSVLVDGWLPLDELARAMNIDPHDFAIDEMAGTVAGLVLRILGRVPKTGDRAHYQGVELEVVDMDRARIDKVLARRVASRA